MKRNSRMTQLFVSGGAQNAVIVAGADHDDDVNDDDDDDAVIVVTPLGVTLRASCVLQTVVHLWTPGAREGEEEDAGRERESG